ncbi:hypothetical protein [Deinococcus sp.]|uniref:hypothetical protein n=1 Tax=Deinococcus sp. TaxID=47478 RepID=UPI003B5C5415
MNTDSYLISPACFSRALGHLVGLGTLSAHEAVRYRHGLVPNSFKLPLPHGGWLEHSPAGYVIRGVRGPSFQADRAWVLG